MKTPACLAAIVPAVLAVTLAGCGDSGSSGNEQAARERFEKDVAQYRGTPAAVASVAVPPAAPATAVLATIGGGSDFSPGDAKSDPVQGQEIAVPTDAPNVPPPI